MKKILIEFIHGGPRIFNCFGPIEVTPDAVQFGQYSFFRKGIKSFFVQDKLELHRSNYEKVNYDSKRID